MTRYDATRRPWPDRSPVVPAPSVRRPRSGDKAGRPVLTLVPGSAADRTPVALSALTRAPMPADVRGAIVTPARGRLMAVWMPLGGPGPFRIPPGRVLLSWTPTGEGCTDVTAQLGRAEGRTLLAVWPGLRGEWSGVVHPTVAQVTELHAALRLATEAQDRPAE